MIAPKLSMHVCPACRPSDHSLTTSPRAADGAVQEGSIHCPACGADYRVTAGVPHFVPATNCAESFGFHWNRHARTQLDNYSGPRWRAALVRSGRLCRHPRPLRAEWRRRFRHQASGRAECCRVMRWHQA